MQGDQYFTDNLVEYKRYLLKCGYTSENIDRKFLKAAKLKKEKTIAPEKQKPPETSSREYYFVTDYDPEFPNIRKYLKKHRHILDKDPECRVLFPKGSLKVTERKRAKNFKELLAPSMFKRKGTETREREILDGKGCYKCGKCGTNNKGRKRASGVVNCGVLSEGNKFSSNSTGEEFNIRQNINCSSTNIIYLITCKRCGMQGEGKATKFNKRISNYITQIEKKIEACCTNKHFFQTEEHSLEDFSNNGDCQIGKSTWEILKP